MKNTNLIISALCVLCMTSCSFFTTSWGTGLQRDLSQTYGKMESNELAQMIGDPAVMNDKEAGQQLLKELGKREDVKSLPAKDKNNVLNLTSNTSISSDTMASVISDAANIKDEADTKKLIENILNQVETVDTKAAETILSNTEDIKNLDPSAASLATVCLVLQVAKTVDITDADKISQNVQSIFEAEEENREAAINSAIADLGLTDENKTTMEVAFSAALELYNLDAEVLPGVTLGKLFGGNAE